MYIYRAESFVLVISRICVRVRACVCVCTLYTVHGLMNRSAPHGAAGFTERGERFVYRRSISMDSSWSGGVSRNGVANKVREARTTGPRPFMKTRANVSRFSRPEPGKKTSLSTNFPF